MCDRPSQQRSKRSGFVLSVASLVSGSRSSGTHKLSEDSGRQACTDLRQLFLICARPVWPHRTAYSQHLQRLLLAASKSCPPCPTYSIRTQTVQDVRARRGFRAAKTSQIVSCLSRLTAYSWHPQRCLFPTHKSHHLSPHLNIWTQGFWELLAQQAFRL
ncbi:hypothetical protein OBBRIDRAFT_136381 [Obba rivulosa]|uniref:Uncharacterized protein n=1 Tax=Obba rivulosa TaxID=1052685 RepID=A0A8E2DI31_9APHY|nr:hypothetical protein OBBRIDRAFT_136381 [Obba rivulosa]